MVMGGGTVVRRRCESGIAVTTFVCVGQFKKSTGIYFNLTRNLLRTALETENLGKTDEDKI